MSAPRASVPLSFFGIAVGLLATANAWRVAGRVWHLPPFVADGLSLLGLGAWLALLALAAHRAVVDGNGLRAELAHPVQSSFAALVPVSSLLAAQALLPFSRPLALVVLALALAAHGAVGLWLHGRLWMGGRAPELATAAMYLPAVAQNFVAAIVLAAFGWTGVAPLAFGVGMLSWLAIESVILRRASGGEPLPPALRPSLGIQLAPPVVGGVGYLAITTGAPDLFVQALFGYGLYHALLLARLLPWIRAQAFVTGYWGFSFGVAALPTLALRMVERGGGGVAAALALPLFVAANLVVALLVARTIALWAGGRLLPVAAPVPVPAAR